MKRTDLKVGDELYCATPYDWANGDESYKSGRAVVLATEPYAKHEGLGWSDSYYQTSKGNGVLVELNEHKTVVPLGHLRGPYADGKRHMDEVAAERRRQYRLDMEERDRRTRERNAIVQRSAAAGVTVQAFGGEFTISAADLSKLLDAIEEADR